VLCNNFAGRERPAAKNPETALASLYRLGPGAARDAIRRSDGALTRFAVEIRTDGGPLMDVKLSFEIERKR
jgi:hypothetical protein